MKLHDAKKRHKVLITSIKNADLRIKLLKIGLHEGAIADVLEKTANGPMLLEYKSQEIALGYEHATLIEVDLLNEKLP